MIENMRKYTGLMIVVLVLLAAGLILTMGNFNATSGNSRKVTSAYGKDIDQNTYRKMGASTLKVIRTSGDQNLAFYSVYNGAYSTSPRELSFLASADPSIKGFILSQITNTGPTDKGTVNFVTNRIIIKKEAEKLGIYPSEQDSVDYIQGNMFQKDGSFDTAAYNEFIKNIGSTGYTQDDFVSLIGEFQVYRKLQVIIGSGIQVAKEDAENFALFQLQTVDATVLNMDLESYKKQVTPTEQEINDYWKLNEGRYLTERELKISYIHAENIYKTTKPQAPFRAPGTSEEDFEKLNAPYKLQLAEWERSEKKANNIIAGKVDDFSLLIEEDGGATFVEQAKKEGFEPVTTEFFSKENAPEDIKTLKNDEGQLIIDILLAQSFGSTAEHQVKAPIKTENDGWFFAKFEQEQTAQPKTFEDAKEQATEEYITEKANEAMKAAAPELKEKILAAINAGTSIADAAKAENLELVDYKAITLPQRNASPLESQVFQHASITNVNSFSKENAFEEGKIGLIYLNKRSVLKDPSTELRISQAAKQQSNVLSQTLFHAYMSEATKKAKVEMPNFK